MTAETSRHALLNMGDLLKQIPGVRLKLRQCHACDRESGYALGFPRFEYRSHLFIKCVHECDIPMLAQVSQYLR
jgi:hypothetical protein